MMNKAKYNPCALKNTWLRQRELGQKPKLGTEDRFLKGLYNSMLPCTTWDHSGESLRGGIPGGIFNLEFSPDGSLLVAACEKKSILMFDPLTRHLIHTVDNAHADCVNCIRFLDSRVFATCSDDSTVALWDARHLKTRIRQLAGHSNWVKNIEFSQKDSLLVTSGFDGKIYTWDINSETSEFTEVFHTNGLMRTRLNPDASKMIICTTGGYLMLIHDLDLNTLGKDLAGFKPNVYRLMQISQSTIPIAATYTHLFSHKRKTNRLEFVTDFPEGDEAEVVSSLQVHPHGWCALSRNISNDENTEWTCVHDIQEVEVVEGEEDSEMSEDDVQGPTTEEGEFVFEVDQPAPPSAVSNEDNNNDQPQPQQEIEEERGQAERRVSSASGSGTFFRGFPLQSRSGITPLTSNDVWEALVAIREVRSQRERERAEAERRLNGIEISLNPDTETQMRIVRMSSGLPETRRALEEQRVLRERLVVDTDSEDSSRERDTDDERSQNGENVESTRSVTSIVIRHRRSRRHERTRERNDDRPGTAPRRERNVIRRPLSEYETMLARMAGHTVVLVGSRSRRHVMLRPSLVKVPNNHRIHQNIPRLTHYIEEPNVGKGFIKELCFSADGRLICSPFGYGVRFLSFSPECSELSTCVPKDNAVKLHEISTNVCHKDIVVSTKFSPKHCLLVSGCLNGRICWHQPFV